MRREKAHSARAKQNWGSQAIGTFIRAHREPIRRLKQITQIEHNIVTNPNWSESNQWAFYKSVQGI